MKIHDTVYIKGEGYDDAPSGNYVLGLNIGCMGYAHHYPLSVKPWPSNKLKRAFRRNRHKHKIPVQWLKLNRPLRNVMYTNVGD